MGLRRSIAVVAAGALVALGMSAFAAPAPPAAAAEPAVRDGSASGLAAASCWDIKQRIPASADGVYWLQTPQLVAPQQFYCDMTTDGGGWVLVGRGRDGWSWYHNGQGSPAALRTTPSGTGAFAPAALPADTVTGLLGGTRVDALPDGIRVRRAKDQAGTQFQELRLKMQARPSWSWEFGGGELLTNVVADGTTYSGGNTQAWASSGNQGLLRLTAAELQAHNYRKGFGYGTQITGANNTTSYLWQYANEAQALPFAQVFIRPKVTAASFTYPAVADTGTAASTVRALMNPITSQSTTWGVNGIVGNGTGEYNVEVEDFAFIGRTVYVAGKFEYVQKGAAPAANERVRQPYLAAFDVDTGEWKPAFRPVLDGTAWTVAASPDGTKVIVGGEFTNANGAANTSAIAALDPTTGATLPTWRASATYDGSNTPVVRGIVVQGDWAYVGGRFNRITGGPNPGATVLTLKSGSRVSLATGLPDPTWKPNIDGTVFELNTSDRGDRIYYAGNFNNINSVSSPMFGAVSTQPGAATVTGFQPWIRSGGSTAIYQQTVLENGNDVWLGGSEHILSKYNRDTMAVASSNITKDGGDFQASVVIDGVLYASCHCGQYNYSNDTSWTNPIPVQGDVNNIKFIGAWDATTGAYLPEFLITGLDARAGMGPWALKKGPDGCMWLGGDIDQGSWTGTAFQWLGGFGKVCPRDTTAPTAPTALTATLSGTAANLSWGASTDDSGNVLYEVLRDDRVIATTNNRTYSDAGVTLPAKYWVRAIDDTGNRSASTASATVQAPDTTKPTASITSPAASASVYGSVPVTVSAADDRGVASVRLLVDGAQVGSPVTQAPYSFTWNATAVGTHTLQAEATDAAGNVGQSAVVTVTVPADTTPPGQVTGLTVASATSDQVALTWSAATDDRGVASYQVFRDGTQVGGTVTGTSFTDTGLAAGTSYAYTVKAVDGAGNVGAASSAVTGTTTGTNQPPLYTDSWPGADGSAWSSSWTTSAVTGTVSTVGGTGSLAYTDTANAYARAQLTGVTAPADADLLTSFQWSSNTALAYANVYIRGSGGWQNSYRPKTGYGLQIQSNTGTAVLSKNVNGTLTTLATVTGASQVGTGKQWLRLRAVGSTVQFKIWTDGQAEPATWANTTTDTAVATGGQVYLSINRAGSNVGDKSVRLDDLVLKAVTP